MYNQSVKTARRGLSLLYLLVGLANLVRGGLAFYVQPALQDWPLALPLPLLGLGYIVAGALFTGLGALLWRRSILRPVLPLALAYQLALWLLRLLADRSSYARALWGRDAVLTALFLALVAALHWRVSPPMRTEN